MFICKMGFMQRCFWLSILCTTISADECYPRPFLFSQALYKAMGVDNCGWFLGRDIATVVWWALVLCWAWKEWKENEKVSPLIFCLLLVAGLIWEFVLSILWLGSFLAVMWAFIPSSNRIDPVASQSMPPAPPESQVMPSAESQIIPAAVAQVAVVARAPDIDVAAVSIDLPIRKATDWKRV
jgi:hypothetical protein